MLKKILTVCALSAAVLAGAAQEDCFWRFGFTGGLHNSYMRISDIDTDLFPHNRKLSSGVVSVYVQKSFGTEMNFAIRPEVAYLHRGGEISDIMRNVVGYYDRYGINDIRYKVKGEYVDARLPLIYRAGNTSWHVRPYAYVAPILGVSTGGRISRSVCAGQNVSSSAPASVSMQATKANLNPVYFSAAAGAGADWLLRIGGNTYSIGAEIMYEHGFTDTYGDDSKATHRLPLVPDTDMASSEYKTGPRRFHGLEIKATVGIPMSIFSRKAKEPEYVEEEYEEEETPEPEPEEAPEPETKDCYTLDEIENLMALGRSVYGKTICAIDDINFDFDKSTIKPESYDYLNRLARTLTRTNARIMVKGHTDDTGPEDVNMRLSKERAISVVNYLKERGVAASKLSYQYFGESEPIDDNSTPEGRRRNRRVEFEILGN